MPIENFLSFKVLQRAFQRYWTLSYPGHLPCSLHALLTCAICTCYSSSITLKTPCVIIISRTVRYLLLLILVKHQIAFLLCWHSLQFNSFMVFHEDMVDYVEPSIHSFRSNSLLVIRLIFIPIYIKCHEPVTTLRMY